ncbi:MAG: phenylalanine--tRNA ligase subunit beta [Capsulimonadaceae bacterium]|nr:phenylalanine--tRNA ligase subunit beta [Capsulimonadaceae bacterium]
MKVPVDWLTDFTGLDGVTEDRLAERLTMAGLEVEEIEEVAGRRVLVTKVTPNRGDWMSVAGTAREAAAALRLPFKSLPVGRSEGAGEVGTIASVDVRRPDWCPRFNIRAIRNIKQGPSPAFMQARLTAAGMRPLGIVVDITNYVMLELGQPLHAYDAAKIPGGEFVVRAAKPGETIRTLDGNERVLTPEMLVIADRTRPIGIAGIMGGGDTEVTEETTTVLLEAAHFDAGVIRRGSKSLGLTTEASYRFERYVDPALTLIAQDRACELFEKYAGATVLNGTIDTNPGAAQTIEVSLRPERANALLGESLRADEMVQALERLQIVPASPGSLAFTVPSFRPDVTREIDLIEEIGRMIGYENLPETLPAIRGEGGKDLPEGAFDSRLRRILIGQGLTEVFTHSLGAETEFDDPAIIAQRVRIRSALSAELSTLRQSLTPNLLAVAALNLRQRQPEVRIFEIGKTYLTSGPGQYSEPRRVAGLLAGGGADYLAIKGIVEALLESLHAGPVRFETAARHAMHPGRTASVILDGRIAGYVAEVDPDLVKSSLDVPSGVGRVAVFDLDVDQLVGAARIGNQEIYAPPPRYPALTRDLSMVFDGGVEYGRIEQAVRDSAGELLESLSLLSVYTGEKVARGKKSVAVRLVLRAASRTLTDVDADAVLSDVQRSLVDSLSGEQRAG